MGGAGRPASAQVSFASARLELYYNSLSREKGCDEIGENLGVDDEPLERIPALPEPSGSRGDKDHLVAGPRRPVQHELGADSERPRILRRVRHARRRLLR